MKTFTPVVALMVMFLLVVPAFGDDESMFQRTLLEDAIDTEIAQLISAKRGTAKRVWRCILKRIEMNWWLI